jgi:hypothetical protein
METKRQETDRIIKCFTGFMAVNNITNAIDQGQQLTLDQAEECVQQVWQAFGAEGEEQIFNSENEVVIEGYIKLKDKIMGAVPFSERQKQTNVVDIIYCKTPEMAKDLFEFLLKKGYAVAQSTVQITTGTHGLQVVKKLDVLTSNK